MPAKICRTLVKPGGAFAPFHFIKHECELLLDLMAHEWRQNGLASL
jgi:hypothetical protein